MVIDPLGQALLTIARNVIHKRFGLEERPVVSHPQLSHPGATFVTLTMNGRLRGCIGSLKAHRPLASDVAENAFSAAFHDPRFTPLAREECAQTRVEVSLLDDPEPVEFIDEADAIARLRPGIDGLILMFGKRQATFLPQVWESLPEPKRFLEQLKLKAGLPIDFWDEKMTFARYGVQKWTEM